MNTRTDVHRPTALIPADYTWVGYTDDGDAYSDRLMDGPLFPPVQAPAADELRREANPSRVRNAIHPGGCDACGQQGLRYRHYFRHDPTGDVIVLGDQCVERMNFDNAEGYKAARKVKAQREQEVIDRQAREWGEANKAALDFLTEAYEGTVKLNGGIEDFVLDLRAKLYRYGSLSEKQTAAVEKIAAKQAEFAAERKQREAEEGEAQPIPAEVREGRSTITGKVVSLKWRESQFGGAFKMVVRDDRGFKVWGTAPDSLFEDSEIPNGTRVRFDAAVTVSDDDETFGFYKRPTKAERV